MLPLVNFITLTLENLLYFCKYIYFFIIYVIIIVLQPPFWIGIHIGWHFLILTGMTLHDIILTSYIRKDSGQYLNNLL